MKYRIREKIDTRGITWYYVQFKFLGLFYLEYMDTFLEKEEALKFYCVKKAGKKTSTIYYSPKCN